MLLQNEIGIEEVGQLWGVMVSLSGAHRTCRMRSPAESWISEPGAQEVTPGWLQVSIWAMV